MRTGVRLGVDVGTVRVGVARSDPAGLLATPVETLRRQPENGADIRRIAEMAAESLAIDVVVGLPRSLSGAEGPAAAAARDYAQELADAVFPATVRLVDERLTTIDAQRVLRDVGRPGRSRRAVVDQVAAVLILQGALDLERSRGEAPGEPVPGRPAPSTEGPRP